eukprot:TRINITY_DN14354_c0_g1::TRINITY_DN14354_c0_g1_i1::g.22912::m.22912 TRINITY_DN14354_c0_g1::TRINITY_DN14354_c0_g1_i1::g.22912  ORF type:complete len:136 (-),score=6.25,sp/Q9UBS8/RNF14_HUMAN/57.14/7e-11,IBR/PF01485.16/5.1e-05,IBR/PF01485.16/4.6e-06,Eapp_C/PF10238.4/0.037,C1_4/PF07975.7/3.2,C1_4/PF07975.7/10,zf-AN1/PF01428.11/1e+02,zf-AN1/PF01428.11/1.1 TRINITY_DN14354_c0_g1_i1:76-444(-)
MSCPMCYAYFCWDCKAVLSRANPYQHFADGGCKLFSDEEIERMRRLEMANMGMEPNRREPPNIQAGDQVRRCPLCRQRNTKEHHNNHLTCWNCKGTFCFLCLAPRIGTGHFVVAGPGCRQHS